MVAPLLSEAVSRNDFATAVSSTSQHVALAGSVALRWERGIRHRAAAHARPGEHEAVVDEAPDDGHGTSSWSA